MMNTVSCDHVTQSYQSGQPQKGTHSYLCAPTVAAMSEMHERIRRARIAAGFNTASEAADRLGMKHHAYRHYESGYRVPPTSRLEDIARAFKVDIQWLVAGKGDKKTDVVEMQELWDRIRAQDKPAALQMLRGLAASSDKNDT